MKHSKLNFSNNKSFSIFAKINKNSNLDNLYQEKSLKNLISDFKENISGLGVWFIHNNSEVLNVAQSENIWLEIENCVECMFDNQFSICGKNELIEPRSKLPFTEEKFQFPRSDSKRRYNYLYNKLRQENEELEIVIINIDEYLCNVQPLKNSYLSMIYESSKDYFAEAMFASDFKAKYWNYYRSGVSARFYKKFNNIK
ncbi:TPA: hypothetical protein VB841_000904 [Streptococcus suis]|nr:hypothetical protein [Streptococcus suis]